MTWRAELASTVIRRRWTAPSGSSWSRGPLQRRAGFEKWVHARRALITAAALWPLQGHAQVLELNSGGAVTVYDRPTVFTALGSTPVPEREAFSARRGRGEAPGAPIVDAATAAALSPALVEAVAWRESRFRSGAVSRAGAIGEMQLMPATARALGVDPRDTRQNYVGGAAYLRVLMHRYDGDLVRALAAYNAGPGAVDHYGGVPPYKETQAYVAAIMDRLSEPALGPRNGSGR